jgi:hypothetical protein
MKTIHYVRHQAAGILTDFPFASAPTDKQIAALAKLCFQRHGEKHPKTREAYWLKVEEVPLLGASDVPSVPERSLSVASEAGAPEFVVEGFGHVENPK